MSVDELVVNVTSRKDQQRIPRSEQVQPFNVNKIRRDTTRPRIATR